MSVQRNARVTSAVLEERPHMIGLECYSTAIYHGALHARLVFQPTARVLAGGQHSPPQRLIWSGVDIVATICDTQAGVPSA